MKTNNQVKLDGLYLRLILDHQRGIKELKNLGDSFLVINHMHSNFSARNNKLNQMLKIALGMLPLFENLHCFHILRDLNTDVVTQANKASQMNEGHTMVHGIEGFLPIP